MMLDKMRGFFGRNAAMAKPAEKVSPPQNSILWSDSLLYNPSDFPKWNPDDLIGRKGYQIYQKMMQDEQIKAAARFRRNAITSREWMFEFDSSAADQLSEEEREQRIKVFTHCIKRIPGSWKSSLNFIMKAMMQGFSVTEKTFDSYEYDGQMWWGIKALKPKPWDTFYVNVDDFGDVIGYFQESGGKHQEISLDNVIWYVINGDVDEHYGQSELREAYRDWYSKDILTKLENIYLERMAGGLVWAEQKDTSGQPMTPNEQAALQSVLSNIQTKTGIMMPRNWGLNVESPSNTDAFKNAIERHDRNMAKALLMPNLMGLTESGQTGSYSQAQTQLEGFLWMLDSDASDLEECLNEQLFKQLGDYNWGDGLYPRIKFKPLSKSQMYAIADLWSKMVQMGAVTASESDEAYLRDMMGFPAKPEEEENDAVDPGQALNGAQVASLVEVIGQVAAGIIPRETGVEIIVAAFPVSNEDADRIMGTVGAGWVPSTMPDISGYPGQVQNPPQDEEPEEEYPDTKEPTESEEPETEEPEEMAKCDHDHTFFPEGGTAHIAMKKAFSMAQRRVDFAAIDRNSTVIEWQSAEAMGETMGRLATYLAEQVRTNDKLLTDPVESEKVLVPADISAELRKESKAALNAAWDIGMVNAKKEVEKAGMNRMSKERFAKFDSVAEIATRYFAAKSFQMAGGLTDEAMKLFKNIILNGIKYSKTQEELVDEIYTAFASKGMITEEQAMDALGQALDVENPTYRLNTIIRTNTFDALNEARYSFFTDPELGGFVTALQYSAILDSATTEICSSLDGVALRADDWSSLRPPNHYNCRSILVPVTQRDEDVVISDSPPDVQPQEGFK